MHDEMSEKKVRTRSGVASVVVIVLFIFGIGYLVGLRGYFSSAVPSPVSGLVAGAQPPKGVDFSPVWKAWNAIDDKFVPAAVATSSRAATSTADANKKRVW